MRGTALVLACCTSFLCLIPISALAQSEAQPEAEPGAESASPPERQEELITVSSRVGQPRRETATPVTVVSADEIEARRYVSLLDVLRAQTAIGVSNAGGLGKVSALRIRGEEGYRTTIRVDGIDISDPSATQVMAPIEHVLATRDIERIEVLRGTQGFSYGADSGGVIAVSNRQGGGAIAGDLGLEYGAYGLRRAEAGFSGGSDRGDFVLSATDFASDGFNSNAADDVVRDDDGYDNTTVHTKLGWTPAGALRLELVARDVAARTEYDNCGFPATHDCVGQLDQSAVRLAADFGSTRLGHSVAVSETRTERSDFADRLPSFVTDGELRRLEYTGSYEASATSQLVYGIDSLREIVRSDPDQRIDHEQDAAFLEYQNAFADRFFLTLGARRDDSDAFGGHTSLRAALAAVRALPGGGRLKYRASYGTGFRAPSPNERAYNASAFAGPPASTIALSEEQSRGLDIGIELSIQGGTRIELGLFDQRISNEIYFDLVAFSGYLQAAGRSHSRGLEFTFDVPVGTRWQVRGNALYNDTATIDDRIRLRRPERIGNLGFRYRSRNGRFGVLGNLRLQDGIVDELFTIGRVPVGGYSVLDVTGSFRPADSIELYARIENVLDRDYRELAGFNAAGAGIYTGIRISLD